MAQSQSEKQLNQIINQLALDGCDEIKVIKLKPNRPKRHQLFGKRQAI